MFRTIMTATLVAGLMLPTSGQVVAAATPQQQETCRETARIVSAAITLRANGTRSNRTKKSLTSGKNEVGERFKPTVEPLVDWVYSLDKGAIAHPEAPKVIGGNFQKDCLAAYK